VIGTIEKLMVHDTAGDPITGLKWTRKTTRKISHELRAAKIDVSPSTVARLLKRLGYSLRVNHKKIARGNSPHRNRQFRYIEKLREAFADGCLPIISVDTKKKELIGRFKNPGAVWAKAPTAVNDHDFRSDALGMAVPYGIYDVQANRGHVFLGISHDTPEFAVDAVAQWWSREGRERYPRADELLILADNGGSNGSRVRAWKHALQTKLCDRFDCAVTVCHYPPGTSKWNPIEHRLFSEISKNWAGRPLETYDVALKYIRTTRTTPGLRVRATLVRREYAIGATIDDSTMAEINLNPHSVLPAWNYTIGPSGREMGTYS
jgi:Rhodopirellula transposase DDE domain